MEIIGKDSWWHRLLFTLLSIKKIADWNNWLLKSALVILSLIAITGVAIADFATEYKTAVSLLYMVPIVLTAWFSWRYTAIIVAFLSGISDSAITTILHKPYAAINTLNSIIQSVFFVIFTYVLLKLKIVLEREEMLSRTDPLTGLLNSRHFHEIGNAEVGRVLRYKHPLSIAYMDIDNFKKINDTLGHSVGDAYLRSTAQTVKTAIRKTDTVARLGGDEFSILFPETGPEQARAVVNRVQQSLLDMASNLKMPVTFSIGIVTTTERPCNFDVLIKAADELMYSAKDSGKNMIKDSILSCPGNNPAKKEGG